MLFSVLLFGASVFGGCDSRHDCDGTVTDVEGNTYNTVVIGDQVWMQENLKTTLFNDGTPIPNITDSTEWINTDGPAYVWYDNDIRNREKFGALYNWQAVGGRTGLCPEGWRVPTDDDYKELELYLGMSREEADGTVWRGINEGGKLKEAGTENWDEPNLGATNESGFTAIPSGRRDHEAKFIGLNWGFTTWTSTEFTETGAAYRHVAARQERIGRNPEGDKRTGFAVRCIKDD